MKALTDTWTIAVMNSVPNMKRSPSEYFVFFLFIAGMPLTFVLAFGGLSNLTSGLIGSFISSLSYLSLTGGQMVIEDHKSRMRQVFVSKPIGRLSYAFGLSIASLLSTAPSLLLFGVLLASRGILGFSDLPLVSAASLLVWLSLSSIGFVIANAALDLKNDMVSSLTSSLGFLFGFIPPVFYPSTALGSFQWVSVLFPTSAAANLIRYSSGGLAFGYLIPLSWASLLLQAVLFSLLAAKKTKWRES